MNKQDAIALIHVAALGQKIDPVFYQAICTVESSLNPLAMRYEPAWNYLYFPREHASRLAITADTETQLQKFSYGLCQIMGSVAREHGFVDSLGMLIAKPELTLRYGAKHLAKFSWKYGGNESDIAAAYNAGSVRKTNGGLYVNQQYVDKVDQELRRLRTMI